MTIEEKIESFFRRYPGSTEVHENGGKLFLNKGVADSYAKTETKKYERGTFLQIRKSVKEAELKIEAKIIAEAKAKEKAEAKAKEEAEAKAKEKAEAKAKEEAEAKAKEEAEAKAKEEAEAKAKEEAEAKKSK